MKRKSTKTDKLLVRCYAKHGDTCSIAPHCESLGCASGHKPDDYVLSAKFAYLQEAIDYCQAITKRGVSMRLISRIVPSAPFVRDYPAERRHSPDEWLGPMTESVTKLTPDVLVRDAGTLLLFCPLTERAKAWISEHVCFAKIRIAGKRAFLGRRNGIYLGELSLGDSQQSFSTSVASAKSHPCYRALRSGRHLAAVVEQAQAARS